MATIAQTTLSGVNGPVTVARTTMTASDTLTYVPGSEQILVLTNTTAGTLTATFTGSITNALSVKGYGGVVSVSAGKAVAVAANSTVYVALDTIAGFLQGTVTITGGTGLIATLTV